MLVNKLSLPLLSWGVCVVLIVVLIKHHYSVALATDLQWMLMPLAKTLNGLLRGEFEVNGQGEWVNAVLHVRLVKECAGINFLLMSLLAYALTVAVKIQASREHFCWSVMPLALLGVCGAAWVTTWLVNVTRIVCAISIVEHEALFACLALSSEQVHRLVGLAIYFPALVTQTYITQKISCRVAIGLAGSLYVLMLVCVPILTGHAFMRGILFIEHVTWVAATLLLAWLVVCVFSWVKKQRQKQRQTASGLHSCAFRSIRCLQFEASQFSHQVDEAVVKMH